MFFAHDSYLDKVMKEDTCENSILHADHSGNIWDFSSL
jgi:hypothetical protein